MQISSSLVFVRSALVIHTYRVHAAVGGYVITEFHSIGGDATSRPCSYIPTKCMQLWVLCDS